MTADVSLQPGHADSIVASHNDATEIETPSVIEFAAVIQQLLVTPDATTMHLDISLLDVSPLTNLIDQEVSVTISSATEPHPKPTKRKPTPKGAPLECA